MQHGHISAASQPDFRAALAESLGHGEIIGEGERRVALLDAGPLAPDVAFIGRSPDSLDYAIMMAREVMMEDSWRLDGKLLTHADLAEIDRQGYEHGNGTTVREQVEEYCGEAL